MFLLLKTELCYLHVLTVFTTTRLVFSPLCDCSSLNLTFIGVLGLMRMKYQQTPQTLIDFPLVLEASDDIRVDFFYFFLVGRDRGK